MAGHLFIDTRMSRHSGIGTYIRNVVARTVPRMADGSYTLLGPAQGDALGAPAGARRAFEPGIYSIAEQLAPLWFGVRRDDVYWTPHYNFPALLRCRHVVTVHDLLHLAMPEFAGGFLKQTYARTFFGQIASRAEKVVCDSRFTADELIRFTGCAESKIEVIHIGVDPFWSRPASVPAPIPGPYFLFVGNVKRHKNLRRLIAALRLFCEERSREHCLVIVGKRDGFIGGDADVVRDAESIPGRVTFTGFVDDETLKAYVQHATALIFPSLYEGFGLPMVEAMASGCPVVASDIPVLREVGGNNGAAIFCDPYSVESIREKLAEVADLPAAARAELIARGRKRAAVFDWDVCAEKTVAVLRDALDR